MKDREPSDRLVLSVVKLGDVTDRLMESSTFQNLPLPIRAVVEPWIAMVEVGGISVASGITKTDSDQKTLKSAAEVAKTVALVTVIAPLALIYVTGFFVGRATIPLLDKRNP